MKVGTAKQQPNERFSYSIDYADALKTGDSIKTVTASATPAGLTVDNPSHYGTRAKWWVSGGVDGGTYKVTVNVETQGGEHFEDEVAFKIKEA